MSADDKDRRTSPDSTPAQSVVDELLMTGLELGQVLERGLRERAGLSVSQFNVLRVVAGREDGTAHAVDLIRVLGLSSAHATTLLQQLEERGLVERRESTADRRRRAVTATPAGRDLLERLRPLLNDLDACIAGVVVSADQRVALHAHLRQVRLALRHGLTAQEWDDCVGP